MTQFTPKESRDMKRALSLLLVSTLWIALAGCCRDRCCCHQPQPGSGCYGCANGQDGCYGQCQSGCIHDRGEETPGGRIRPFQQGPTTPQVTWPYYSLHGPRDYFADNPQTLGP